MSPLSISRGLQVSTNVIFPTLLPLKTQLLFTADNHTTEGDLLMDLSNGERETQLWSAWTFLLFFEQIC